MLIQKGPLTIQARKIGEGGGWGGWGGGGGGEGGKLPPTQIRVKKDCLVSHHRNICSFAIEKYKVKKNISTTKMLELFEKHNLSNRYL